MSDHEDYTVGWVCSSRTEYQAARAVLDKDHEQLGYSLPRDDNAYTLGKIGRHNIVIAVLPYGKCETSTAAMVATHMLRSFPNVRFILMVVTGGGAPSAYHDIRLGDIVVGASGGGPGGVFQFDVGKKRQDHDFQRTEAFDQPPIVLQAAVSELMAHYERRGHRLEESIERNLTKNPRLRETFERPPPISDTLYRANFCHSSNVERCAVVCDGDPSDTIWRRERPKEENPAVHYGLVASSNHLVQDAHFRDELAARHSVLCFDKGAAGVTTNFPCLVILGISNYSDSHKYKEWQGYAAMAAAAYAKDLLYRIPHTKIASENRSSDIVSDQTQETSVVSATGLSRSHELMAQVRPRRTHVWELPGTEISGEAPHDSHRRDALANTRFLDQSAASNLPSSGRSPKLEKTKQTSRFRMRPCYIMCLLMVLIVAGSAILGIYYAVQLDKAGDGFTAASWVVGVCTLSLAGPIAYHYPHCTCWKRELPYLGLRRANTLGLDA